MTGQIKILSQSLVFKILLLIGTILIGTFGICTFLYKVNFFYGSENKIFSLLFKAPILLGMAILFATLALIYLSFLWFFTHPIEKLIDATRRLAKGETDALEHLDLKGEMGRLAVTISEMGQEISIQQLELNRQKNQYRQLFELVPCIITVQDRDFKLIGYNEEFSKRFDPIPGDYCYSAYKGRTEKCENCPVDRTFEDGECHFSEETGINRDGTMTHWIAKTAPMRDEKGEIVGAMELNLDITQKKELEGLLKESEKQYAAIFNNIPNPIFLLDQESLEILNCNESVSTVYGYQKGEMLCTSFLELFADDDKSRVAAMVKTLKEMNNVKHIHKSGKTLIVNIWISPSRFQEQDVLLVSTRDVTEHVEAELQLIQSSKMATLGEMATGVAHELNQPLTVIKTVSSFFMKKIRNKEKIDDDILYTLAEEVDTHVDRAATIINHMRQFGRKSDISLELVQANDVLKEAFNIFNQQFKLREIDVIWRLEEGLPLVMAEPIRLEQVFINLLTNARDAIDIKWQTQPPDADEEKVISLHTYSKQKAVILEICDTGTGIPESLISKIFEPFFTTKKVGQGTGIGLSISYGIIQEFQGNIRVESTPGEGACFVVNLPKGEVD